MLAIVEINKLHTKWSTPVRYALAFAIFLVALLLHFWVLPVDSGLPFLMFYPAIVVSFYLCGIGPGVLTLALTAVISNHIFAPPFWPSSHQPGGHIALAAFLLSSSLIGLLARKLQTYAAQFRETLADLEASKQRYRTVLDDQTETICRFKADGTILYVNEAFCRLFGKSRESLIGHKWHPVALNEDIPLINEKLNTLSPTNPVVIIENRIVISGGAIRWGQFVNHAIFDREGRLEETQAVGRDITELKGAQDELRRLTLEQHAMLDNDLVGIAKVRDRCFVWRNKAMDRIFGYDSGELEGAQTRILYTDDSAYQTLGDLAYPVLKAHGIYRTQMWLDRKNGEKVWVDISGVLLPEQDMESLWMFADITPIKKHQEQVEFVAYHDPLTGLPNRLLLADRLGQALAHSERLEMLLAVCYLDLDGFKPINDKFGHAAGDKLLIEIARRLQLTIRANDTACRLGGDEFVLLLTNLNNADEYYTALQRLIAAINEPIALDESCEVIVTASIGITLFPFDSNDPDTLLRHSDQAMYQAKKLGRNRVCLYTPNILENVTLI